MSRASLWANARFGIVKGGARGKTDGFVGKNIINTGINFKNEVREQEMGTSVIAGEVAAARKFSMATKGV